MSPPWIDTGGNMPPGMTPKIIKSPGGGGNGNPFGSYFVGFSDLGFQGGGDLVPPPGYQAGDRLHCLATITQIPGWSGLHGVAGTPNNFFRIATGDANDNIPSATTGVMRQIFAFRNNAEFADDGFIAAAASTPSQLAMSTFANNALGDAAIMVVAAWRVTGIPTRVDPPLGFTKIGERVGSGLVAVTGIQFQAAAVNVPADECDYAVQDANITNSNMCRFIVNNLP